MAPVQEGLLLLHFRLSVKLDSDTFPGRVLWLFFLRALPGFFLVSESVSSSPHFFCDNFTIVLH